MYKCLGRGGGGVNMQEVQMDLKNILKNEKNTLSLGVVSSLNWGVFTPPRGGCKNISADI